MQVGNLCWAPDKDTAFVPGKVKELKGADKLIVEREDGAGTVECKKTETHERCSQRTTKQEMDDLAPLNMAEVLENVCVLFHQPQLSVPGKGPAKIYSSVGPVLITMNPFEKLPVTSEAWRKAYHTADNVGNKRLGPHAFRTAEESLRKLSVQPKQAIVICGESGAGKTYTNRDMLAYLCEVTKDGSGSSGSDPDQITQSCMVLEAFGNASTKRNDNSSRFGRLTTLFFNDNNNVLGCGTNAYLLERSRINGPPENERNYHVFYQLLRGGTAESYELLPDPEKYSFTQKGAKVKQPKVYDGCADDKEDFAELKRKMLKAGFSEDVLAAIWSSIAAVLHLGSVTVSGSGQASVDASVLNKACKLLGVDSNLLNKYLTHKLVQIPKSDPIEKALNKVQSESMRDGVAKMIYSRIFDHIVGVVDNNLKGGCNGEGKAIGLLDIFGFEDMDCNGFEQLFINFTNERIQHLFNTVMFDREKVAYEEEGINSDFLQGPKNIECVKLFLAKRPPGIVQLLADACSQNKEDGVDGEHFVSLLNRTYKANDYFKVCDFKDVNAVLKRKGLAKKGGVTMDYKACFVVKHYAGEILYTVEDFVPKSRDSLSPELTKVLASSSVPFVRGLFECDANIDPKSASTVGHKFRESLESLADTLDKGDALFVRCIKSNHAKVPNVVDRPIVIEQLTLGGVVAALEVRAKGLPDRQTYEDFCSEFGFIHPGEVPSVPKEGCQAILRNFLPEREALNHFKFGNTKVFMKTGILSFLRGCANFKTNHCARRIQRRLWCTRVGKIEKAWKQLDESEAWAKERGIDGLKAVKEAFQLARDKCRPAYEAMQEAKKTHYDQNEVAMCLESFAPTVKSLLYVSDKAAEVVAKYERRKAELETGLNVRLSEAATETNSMLSKLKLIEDDAEECADVADQAEMEKCRGAIRATRAKIEKLQNDVFPGLKQQDTSSGSKIDLETEPWQVPDPCPQLTILVKEAGNLLETAENECYAVLRVRREFNKALEDQMPMIEEHRNILESLREQGRDCVAEGLLDIADTITKSDRLNIVLEQIQAASKEPELFRTKAVEFVESVKIAQAAVEKGREELQRRARERAERSALSDKLDELSEKVDHAKKFLMKEREKLIGGDLPKDAAACMADIIPLVARLRLESASPLEEWKPKVEDAYQKGMEAVEVLEKFVSEGHEKSKAAFAARRAMFGK